MSPRSLLPRRLVLALALAASLGAQDLLATPRPTPALEGPQALERAALSPDGLAAVLLQKDGSLRVLEVPTGKVLREAPAVPGKVVALALAGPAGPAFVATAERIWTLPLAAGAAAAKLWDADGAIQGLSIGPDGDLLAVATAKGARVLHPGTGEALWSPSFFSAAGKPCAAVAFAPVGGGLALALGRTVQLHAVPGFKVRQTWALDFPVLALAWAPDARSLAVGGGQGALLVKRAADGDTLHRLATDLGGADLRQAAFAFDGTGLFVAGGRRLQSFSGLDEATPFPRTVDLDGEVAVLAFSRPAAALFAATGTGRGLQRWGVVDPFRAARARRDQPWIGLLAPAPNTRLDRATVEVAFKIAFPPDQPVTSVRVLADGRPARLSLPAGEAPAQGGVWTRAFQSGQVYACQVTLPERDATLQFAAEGPRGSSEPALLPLQWGQPVRPPGGARAVPPTLTLVSPAVESTVAGATFEVALRVASVPGQPVQVVRLALDGVPVPLREVQRAGGGAFDPAAGWVEGELYRLTLPAPDRDALLTVVAETAYAGSVPVEARLRRRGTGTVAGGSAAPAPGEAAGARPGEVPAGVRAAAEHGTRILEGGPQGAPVPMEVDAQGRLRWRGKPAETGRKATTRGAAPAATPGAAPPPRAAGQATLQITAPAGGAKFKESQVQLTVKLGPGPEIGRVQAFVDGSPAVAEVLSSSGAPVNPPFTAGQVLKLKVALPTQDCQVSVLAENAAGPGRPALVKLKYDGKAAPAGAVRGVAQLAKPRVAIFEPQPGALVRGSVRLGLRVAVDPRQPPPAIRILVDAQEVKAERAAAPPAAGTPAAPAGGPEQLQYWTVPLPPKDCTVVAYAETPYATSDPSLVKLRWDSPAAGSASGGGLPTLYLLSVGVSKYKDKNFTLQYPAKDAKDFADTMKLQKGKLYKDVVTRLRMDETATRDNVMDDLEWIQRQATQRDVVMVFLAGHGINDVVTGNYYYLPWDASMEAVKRTMIPGSEIHSTLARLTGTRLLFMDTCHAGNVTGTATRGIPDLRQFLQDLKDGGQGLVVITSSRPGQKSQEHPAWNNGAFTKALVEGLTGKAPQDRQGFITFTALDAYITGRVKELTKGTQSPATQKSTEVSDFPLAFPGN